MPESRFESWFAVLPLEVQQFTFSPPVHTFRVDRLVDTGDAAGHPDADLWRSYRDKYFVPLIQTSLFGPGRSVVGTQPDGDDLIVWTQRDSILPKGLALSRLTLSRGCGTTADEVVLQGAWSLDVYSDPAHFQGKTVIQWARSSFEGHRTLDDSLCVATLRRYEIRQFLHGGFVPEFAERYRKALGAKDWAAMEALAAELADLKPDFTRTTTLTLVDYDPTPLALKDIGMRNDPRIATPAPVEYHDRNEEWNQRTPAPDYRRNPR
jgi:hypothetical protein